MVNYPMIIWGESTTILGDYEPTFHVQLPK